LIKEIIKYLKDVYDGEKIEGLSQSFFISNKEEDMNEIIWGDVDKENDLVESV